MMELSDTPPLFEHTIETMSKEDMIVVGVEYFFMPKYSGMRLIMLAAIAFMINFNAPPPIIDKVRGSCIMGTIAFAVNKIALSTISDTTILLNVKMAIMANLLRRIFFRLIGYINRMFIVFDLYSSIMNRDIKTAAKTINIIRTNESTPTKREV